MISTLVTKVFGVSFAVASKLCIGKEGPLAHIGAAIGAMCLYMPCIDLRHLHNDENKRIFIAAGASSGVSVAFGAPIGGALFVYELSRPNTFWEFKMIWKVFFCCCTSCFTFAIWLGIKKGDFTDWSGASLKFGHLQDTTTVNVFILVPAAIVLGIIGGLMGSFFINVNTRINVIRGKYLTTKWIKVVETILMSVFTASIFFMTPYWMNSGRCPKRMKDEDVEW